MKSIKPLTKEQQEMVFSLQGLIDMMMEANIGFAVDAFCACVTCFNKEGVEKCFGAIDFESEGMEYMANVYENENFEVVNFPSESVVVDADDTIGIQFK